MGEGKRRNIEETIKFILDGSQMSLSGWKDTEIIEAAGRLAEADDKKV